MRPWSERDAGREQPGTEAAAAAGQDAAKLESVTPSAPWATWAFANLTGLPPMSILVGTSEVLLDDSTRLVDRARDAGVDVTLHIAEDMYHLWPIRSSFLPEAREAVAEIGRFVQSRASRARFRAQRVIPREL